MAATINLGLSTYLIDFSGGQSAFRTPPYTQYATDLDTNFVTLRNTINTMINEIKAVQGPNSTLGVDILIFNDDVAHTPDPIADGLIGLHSYLTTIGTPTSQLEVNVGDVLLDGQKASLVSPVTLVGSGGSGTRWVALDVNGFPTLETAADQQQLDIYSAAWNGSAFTSVTRLAEVFFDGDEYENMRDRPAAGSTPATFPALNFAQFHHRMEAVERILAGLTTDGEGNALGQPAIRTGSAAAPGLVIVGSSNTGIYGTTTTVSIATAGVSRVTISSAGLTMTVPFLVALGSAGSPSYSFTGDTDTGIYSPAANRLGFSTQGNKAAEFDAQGNLDLDRNARVKGIRSSNQSISDATPTLVDFNAADAFDIGAGTDNWHDHTSGTLSDRQEFTVPTDCDGLYAIVADYEWAAPTNITDIIIEVTVGGTADVSKVEDQIPAGEPRQGQLVIYRTLSASDIVRMQVTQDDTAGTAALNLERASLSIIKVA